MKAKHLLVLLSLGLCIAPVAVVFIARHELPNRIRVPVQPSDLRFSSVHISRYGDIQIQFRSSESANPQVRDIMTRITPVWSLFRVDGHRTRWLVNINTGNDTYWDDEALTK